MGADGSSVAVSGVTDFNYAHYATLAKLGVAWQTAGWNAGVSVTTPEPGRLRQRQGRATRVSLAGTDADGDGRPDPPYLVTDGRREDSTATTTRPWAIGFGASAARGQDAPLR